MKLYFLLFLTSFMLGILFDKYILTRFKLTIKVEKIFNNKPLEIKNNSALHPKNSKYYKAECLFKYLRNNNTLPIRIQASVLHGLKEIAKSKNWQNEIDDLTLENLNKIYDRLQRKLNSSNNNAVQKVGKAGNMDEPKYWEGTEQEYNEALKNGLIDENTHVNIVIDDADYHGSWITHNPDGSVEEYMD